MAHKPKIHIFLGAPTLPIKTAPSAEPDCNRWETLDLCLTGARLRRKRNEHGAEGSESSTAGGVSDLQHRIDKASGNDISTMGRVSDQHSWADKGTESDISTAGRISDQQDRIDKATGSDISTTGGVSDQGGRNNQASLDCENLDRIHMDLNEGLVKDAPVSGNDGERTSVPHPDINIEEKGPSQRRRSTHDEQDLHPETVKDYLDSCFLVPGLGQGVEPAGGEAQPPLSLEAEFMSIWTTSQALLLKGRRGQQTGSSPEGSGAPHIPKTSPPAGSGSSPELYTPESSPRGAQEGSQELFLTLSERQEEGGVVIQAVPQGVLCSQSTSSTNISGEEAGSLWASPKPGPSVRTSPTSPSSKRSRVSPTIAKTPERQTVGTCVPLQCGPTTPLNRCESRGVRYSVLVAVVYPCHLKEIKVKSGTWAGSTVPLATIVVTDQSGVDMKVVLWRTAAYWALTVYPGDLLFITGLMLHEDKWRGEVVLQSSYSSRLLNLGQLTACLPPPVPQNVSGRAVKELWTHLCKKHPLLVTLPRRAVQDPQAIPYARLRLLQQDTLVHALLKVTCAAMVTAWRDEAESSSRTGGVQKALLSVEQGDGHQGALVLWGSAMAWLQRIHRNQGAVWEFRVLLVKRNTATGRLELHSTPWGSCEPLFPNDKRAVEFHSWAPSKTSTASLEIDLCTLLSQKYSGDVEFKGQIVAFQFQGTSSQNASLLMNEETPSQKILETMSGDVTFTGCGRCGAELETDDNGIYRPCYPCLPQTSVRRYYRPAVLTVKDGSSQVCVQVPSSLVQKILLNTSPDKLNKTIDASSDVRFTQVVANRLQSLLSIPRSTVLLTVSSHFQCDENSVPIVQDFLLLDIQA
ncbi:hypothetical protein GJAV_G00242340 [Gymnothorax javanicus]|nr:hypothetical protein GJAV_G00242340 [Gymnothorax javanicus]